MLNNDFNASTLRLQEDFKNVELVSVGEYASIFKVDQVVQGIYTPKIVRVIEKTKSYFSLKREKDLLRYLNQFEEDFPTFHEVRKASSFYLQIFDYYTPTSLTKQVKSKSLLSSYEVMKLLSDMLSTLQKTNDVGFVHSDIRPDNIICDDRFYLTGWSQTIPSYPSFETELIMGDKLYCPPERMNGDLTVSGDIYSLGCVLYFALTGQHIFGLDNSQNSFQQLYAQAHFIPIKHKKISDIWFKLIYWMTEKNETERPSLQDLNRWMVDRKTPKTLDVLTLKNSSKKQTIPKNCLDVLSSQNYYYAMFKKGLFLEDRNNGEEALRLIEKAAFSGYSRAQAKLGEFYEKGELLKQSYLKALNYYHQAYEKGNPYATFRLAEMFENGREVNVDIKKAFSLYKFAALRGVPSSQNRLGELYEQGLATIQNDTQAHFWFNIAALNGDNDAQKNIIRLDACG